MKTGQLASDRVSLLWRQRSSVRSDAGAAMEQNRCTSLFLALAVILDLAGLLLLLVGIFARLRFWDFLVLSGPLLIFLSLVLWIFWYLGNLTVSEDQLEQHGRDVL